MSWTQTNQGDWSHLTQENSLHHTGRVCVRDDMPGRRTCAGVCIQPGQVDENVTMVPLMSKQKKNINVLVTENIIVEAVELLDEGDGSAWIKLYQKHTHYYDIQ